MDDSGIFTGTICDEFPPGRGSTDSKNKNQTLPNIVVSNHRDCCTASSPAPTACPTIDYSCHKGHTYTPSHCPVEGEDREVAGLDSDCKESDEYGEGPLPEREKLLPSAVDTSCSVVQQRKVFDVPSLSGSVNHAVCPIRPKMDVCLLVRMYVLVNRFSTCRSVCTCMIYNGGNFKVKCAFFNFDYNYVSELPLYYFTF